ncbi:septation ring formation regulator EzrA [Acidipropionibacterium acidipropionici]|uniref:Septation ring formation regulator EzrA n=2 Tax=Acidipropionibacterium acidipropionici TaxID=1748 RepID=A0AAC8YIR0_9ACTN|nr:septation ring formation regulator EzrA [Acidipropionibacterium acidipropionici]AOZ48525.1 septation ring formation regulator EzrA [Acidipropionibacterium acidipropionici]
MITPSLGVYFNQKAELSRLADEEAQHKKSIASLQDELKRWDDPNYVRAQARSQLGWVVPGETGYRVIGKDGKMLGGGVSLEPAGDAATAGQQNSWWRRMVGSIKTADSPQRAVPSQTPR